MMRFMDGFDHYGTGSVTTPLDGVYADGFGSQSSIGVPSWGAAPTGGLAVNVGQSAAPRKVFDWGAMTEFFVGFRIGFDNLPNGNDVTSIGILLDGGNHAQFTLFCASTGDIYMRDQRTGQGNRIVFQTQAPVLVARSWQFIEYKIDTAADTFRLDVDGVTVIDANGCGFTSASIPQMDLCAVVAGASFQSVWIDDFNIHDATGDFNNTFEGDLRIATLFANADGPDQGWTPEYRQKIGTGILDNTTNYTTNFPPALYCGPSTSLDIGPNDFTIEGFWRFHSLPTGGNMAHLAGKWDDVHNQRSFQLYLGGPTLESGNIVFRTSTDGLSGTVVEKISYPWPGGMPDLNTWYNIALVRESGELLLFIDGVQYGLPVADSDGYFAGNSPFTVNANYSLGPAAVGNTGFDGWTDEFRFTPGVGRYSGNYTVTTIPYARGTGDADWTFVALLCGFDSGISDESSYSRAVAAVNGPLAITPDDGTAAFQTISHRVPQDDTFIEAALLYAGNILTLAANPTANDTVTVGTYTSSGSHAAVYKFVAAVAAAFDVKIGVDMPTSLFNLRAAINLDGGSGTLYGAGTIVNDVVSGSGLPGDQMAATANLAGTAGNSIASTSSLTGGGGWASATLTAGADIPGDSDFYFQRPPSNTTIVKAAQIVTRAFKTDAGTGSIQTTFVGPLGGTEDGEDNPLTLAPTYRWDVFETDPDTSAAITPATIVGGRVRVNRTA